MTVEQMREEILNVYPSESWETRVKRMPDDQVTAIYLKFSASGKFDKNKKNIEKAASDLEKPEQTCEDENVFGVSTYGEQLSLFD